MKKETYTVLVDPVIIDSQTMKEMLEDAIFDYSVDVANANGVDLGSTKFDDYYREVREMAEQVFQFTHYFQYISLVSVKAMLETGMASLNVSSATENDVEQDLTTAVQMLSTILSGTLVHLILSKDNAWTDNETLQNADKSIRSVPFEFHATLEEREGEGE
jgi:hypothetical protein